MNTQESVKLVSIKSQEVERENKARQKALYAEKEAKNARRLDALEQEVACLRHEIKSIVTKYEIKKGK